MHYQVVLVEAVPPLARFDARSAPCSSAPARSPGDTQRNLDIFPEYSGETFKHILVPVWLLTYTYGPKVFQVVANGYTGEIAGRVSEEPVEDRRRHPAARNHRHRDDYGPGSEIVAAPP